MVVSWNATKTLIKGSVNTETQITEAGVSIAKSGLGWAEVLELPGEDGWVEHNGRIIRFAKRFGLQVPVSPVLAGLPVVGETMKELGATMTWRVETEGMLDVVSYLGNLQMNIY